MSLCEDEFARYIGTEHAISTCSARNGLELLLEAYGLEKGDEVIMPAYTLKDLIQLIQRKGFVPVLVDVDKDSFNINPDLIEEKITPKTKVIVAAHLFGAPCDIEKIVDIGRKCNIKIIEDCAHACGTEIRGKKAGYFADAAIFSFETLKAINAFGGGMITTNNSDLAADLRQRLDEYPSRGRQVVAKIIFCYFEHLFIKSPFYPLVMILFQYSLSHWFISKLYLFLHGKSRVNKFVFTNLQAYMVLQQLPRLDECNEKRRIIAQSLKEKLLSGIIPQEVLVGGKHIYYFFVVKVKTVDILENVRGRLFWKGIDAGVSGEVTDNCALILDNSEEYPVTREIYNSALQLPMYDELTDKEIEKIRSLIGTL